MIQMMLLAKKLVTFIGNKLPVGMRTPKTKYGPIGLANELLVKSMLKVEITQGKMMLSRRDRAQR